MGQKLRPPKSGGHPSRKTQQNVRKRGVGALSVTFGCVYLEERPGWLRVIV